MTEGTRLFLIADNPAFGSWAPAGDAVVADIKLALATLLAGPAPLARDEPARWQRPAPLDFLALAAGQSVAARRAQGKVALAEALAWSFAADVPTLVEVLVD